MNLSQLKQGKLGIVIAMEHEPDKSRRLQDLGIVRGTLITCVNVSPFGDPVAYSIRNTIIALRIEDAEKIYIREVDNGESNCICRESQCGEKYTL